MDLEQRTARLTILVDPRKKTAFVRLCAEEDATPSQVVRRLIRDYLAQHGASFQPAGMGEAGTHEGAGAGKAPGARPAAHGGRPAKG